MDNFVKNAQKFFLQRSERRKLDQNGFSLKWFLTSTR
jgi:hypothetical protein